MADINRDVLYYATTTAAMVALDLRAIPITDAAITKAQITAVLEFLVENKLITVATDEEIDKASTWGLPSRAKRHNEIINEAMGPRP